MYNFKDGEKDVPRLLVNHINKIKAIDVANYEANAEVVFEMDNKYGEIQFLLQYKEN